MSLSTADKNTIVILNSTEITSIEEGLRILEQLKQLNGDLSNDGELKKSIEALLKGETIDNVDKAIVGLSKLAELKNEQIKAQTNNEDIAKLVADYENDLARGELDEQASERFRDLLNKNQNLSNENRRNIERLIKAQTELKVESDRLMAEDEVKKTKVETETKSESLKKENEVKKEAEINQSKIDEKIESNRLKAEEEVLVVKKKIEDLSQKITKDLGGDEEVKQKIQTKLEEIVKEETIKSSDEEIRELVEAMANGQEITPGVQMKAKEIKLGIDKWKVEHIEETREYQRVEFEKEFVEKTKEKNPNLTEDQLLATKEKAQLMGKVIFSDGGIENQKEAVLQDNKNVSKVEVNESYSQLVVISGLLRQQSEEFEQTREGYIKVDSRLEGVEQPFEMTRVRSFDGVMHALDDKGTLNAFRSLKNGRGVIKNISKFTGGWWNKGVTKISGHFASKISNQAVAGFVKSSMGSLLQYGLKGGFSAILKSLVGKVAVSLAGKAVVAGVAGAFTGGLGTLVVLAASAVRKMLKGLAEKLGLGSKKFFEDNFGKVGGGLVKGLTMIVTIPAILLGSMGAAIAGPIVIGSVVGLFAVNQYTASSLVSSLVPNVAKCGGLEQDPDKGTIDSKCDQSGKVMGINQCSPENSKLTMNAGCSSHTVCARGCGMVSVAIILQCHDAKNTPKCFITPSLGCKTNFSTRSGACPISWTSMSNTLMMNLGKGALYNNGKKFQCRKSTVSKMLCEGWVLIVNFQRSDGSGHWLVAAATTSTGDVALADPSYSDKKFNYWSNIINDRHARPTYCLAIKASAI